MDSMRYRRCAAVLDEAERVMMAFRIGTDYGTMIGKIHLPENYVNLVGGAKREPAVHRLRASFLRGFRRDPRCIGTLKRS